MSTVRLTETMMIRIVVRKQMRKNTESASTRCERGGRGRSLLRRRGTAFAVAEAATHPEAVRRRRRRRPVRRRPRPDAAQEAALEA